MRSSDEVALIFQRGCMPDSSGEIFDPPESVCINFASAVESFGAAVVISCEVLDDHGLHHLITLVIAIQLPSLGVV